MSSVSQKEEWELSFAGQGGKWTTDEDASETTKKLQSWPTDKLHALRFSGNTIGLGAAKAIGSALESRSELQDCFWSDIFTGRQKEELAPSLRAMLIGLETAKAHLHELDLSDNAFGPNGIVGLTPTLSSATAHCAHTLRVLRLNNNGLGIQGAKLLAEALDKCVSNCEQNGTPFALEVFVAGRNRLEIDGSVALAAVFRKFKSLKEFAVPQNGIRAPGIWELTDALSRHEALQVLNLADNLLNRGGAEAVAKLLPKVQSLRVLNLSDCLLKNAGAAAIASALENSNDALEELNLCGNEVKRSGAQKVAEAVVGKSRLQREGLALDENELGEEGIELLRSTLEAAGLSQVLAPIENDEGEDDEDAEAAASDGSQSDRGEGEGEADADRTLGSEVDSATTQKISLPPASATSDTVVNPKGDVPPGTSSSAPSDSRCDSTCVTDLERCIANLSLNNEAEIFLKSLSSEKLLSGSINAATLKEKLNTDPTLYARFIILSSCHVESSKISQLFPLIDECLKNSFAESCTFASVFCNEILVLLGLIKGEEKKLPPVSAASSVRSALSLLAHCVRQPHFASPCASTAPHSQPSLLPPPPPLPLHLPPNAILKCVLVRRESTKRLEELFAKLPATSTERDALRREWDELVHTLEASA